MIPYFRQPELYLGPITVHAFGVLVACALLVGMRIVRRRAAEEGLPGRGVDRFLGWVLLGGFAGAHLFDRFVYFPAATIADPLSVLRFWESLSSFGGFIGGTIGALLFFRRYAMPGSVWKYVDSFAYAFPFAWILGRLGCFVAFDHPGRPTRFVLGQVYSDGVVRHNLGLEEAIYTVAIAAVFHLLGRKPRFPGFFLGLFMVFYAPFRFSADFLRIVDVRYGGLTPGQYGSIALFVAGVSLLVARQRFTAGQQADLGGTPSSRRT
jgi:phosphatidylglycerol:prolipoprotein diacylglycerol transferase